MRRSESVSTATSSTVPTSTVRARESRRGTFMLLGAILFVPVSAFVTAVLALATCIFAYNSGSGAIGLTGPLTLIFAGGIAFLAYTLNKQRAKISAADFGHTRALASVIITAVCLVFPVLDLLVIAEFAR